MHSSTVALREIDLAIAAGEVVAVMGRNGAGKTTLLRAIAGLHAPTAGTVSVGGAEPSVGHSVALCPQEPDRILFRDSVADEIGATLEAHGRASELDDVIARFSLDDVRFRNPRDLSAGQRLLVATAAVMATGAEVLLLDEPTRGLDIESKERLGHLLRSLAETGTTVAFATHDVEMTALVADRVVMLAGGEVIADGPVTEVLGDSSIFAPQMTRVFGRGWITPGQVAAALVAT